MNLLFCYITAFNSMVPNVLITFINENYFKFYYLFLVLFLLFIRKYGSYKESIILGKLSFNVSRQIKFRFAKTCLHIISRHKWHSIPYEWKSFSLFPGLSLLPYPLSSSSLFSCLFGAKRSTYIASLVISSDNNYRVKYEILQALRD